MFSIQPCQTIWSYSDNDQSTMTCVVRVPKGGLPLAFEVNHLLVKHPLVSEHQIELFVYEQLRFVAFELSRPISDTYWRDGLKFLGVVRFGQDLSSFAVFQIPPDPVS